MAVTTMKCPSCGAGLSPPPGHRSFPCVYCGTHVDVAPKPGPRRGPVQVHRVVSSGQTSGPSSDPGGAKIVKWILLAVFGSLFFVFAGVGYTVFSAVKGVTAGVEALGAASGTVPGFGADSAVPGLNAQESLLWDDVGGQPLPLKVGDKPAFLGRVRVTPSDELFFVAVASDGQELFRSGPYGTYSDGYRHTFAAIAGDRAALTDASAKLHLVDTSDGATLKTLDLSDRVKTICGAADGSTFWVEQIDKREFLLDPKSGELREGERPDGCRSAEPRWGLIPDESQRRKLRRLSKKIDDFEAERFLEDGERTIVAGVRKPGTKVPAAVGLAEDGSIAWRVEVPSIDPLRAREGSNSHDDVGGGRYVTVYGEGSDTWHVTAFDSETGDRLWDQSLRSVFAVDSIDGVIVTEDYVLIVRTSSLEVLDPATGGLRGTIGRETYE